MKLKIVHSDIMPPDDFVEFCMMANKLTNSSYGVNKLVFDIDDAMITFFMLRWGKYLTTKAVE